MKTEVVYTLRCSWSSGLYVFWNSRDFYLGFPLSFSGSAESYTECLQLQFDKFTTEHNNADIFIFNQQW